MDHQIPKSLTYPLGTWVHMLQSFPVLLALLGKDWWARDAWWILSQSAVLIAPGECLWPAVCHCYNQTEKVEFGYPPKQDLYNPACSHVLSKCVAWLLAMFFGTMGLFLLPDYFVLRSAASSWYEWLFMLICVLSLLAGLCGTLSWICCCSWGPVFAFAMVPPFLFSRALCSLF